MTSSIQGGTEDRRSERVADIGRRVALAWGLPCGSLAGIATSAAILLPVFTLQGIMSMGEGISSLLLYAMLPVTAFVVVTLVLYTVVIFVSFSVSLWRYGGMAAGEAVLEGRSALRTSFLMSLRVNAVVCGATATAPLALSPIAWALQGFSSEALHSTLLALGYTLGTLLSFFALFTPVSGLTVCLVIVKRILRIAGPSAR